jgi:hypothetical protein
MFDEHLSRNQDDEFNGRIRKGGGRIMLLPDVRIRYHARPTLMSMMKMFYQYGWFKPLVNLKLGSPATLRQFAPPLMVLGTFAALLMLWVGILPFSWVLFPAVIYVLFTALVSLMIASGNGWNLWPLLMVVFPAIHYSYGIGYVRGIWDFMLSKRHLRGQTMVKDNR